MEYIIMSKNPFAEQMKMFTDNQYMNNFMKNMPNYDMNKMSDLYKNSAETFSNASKLSSDNMQAIMNRNAEIMQETAKEMFNYMQDLGSVSSPEQYLSKHQQHMQKVVKKAMDNSKELAEMTSKSSMEVYEKLGQELTKYFNNVCGEKKKAAA